MLIQAKKLNGLAPGLREVVVDAGKEVDIIVLEGLRSQVRQEALVKAGASKTLRSKHLIGEAVDLGAIVDNEVRWDWPLYFELAKYVQISAKKLSISIVWGGCWSALNQDLSPEELQEAYIEKCRLSKKKPFLDGPHFELANGDLISA